MTALHLDFETKSRVDLKRAGLDRYSADESTKALMCAYAFDDEEPRLWQRGDGAFPKAVIEAVQDPHVEKWAFNSPFERYTLRRQIGIKTPVAGWRDTMVLAFMQSFTGTLDQIGKQVGLPLEKQKLADGKRLINVFCKPQRLTKNRTEEWRDEWTDPEDWEAFCGYCKQDVVTERAIKKRLIKFPILPFEWELFEHDLLTNERGFPLDMDFIENAIRMADRRKAELVAEMREITGLANPNSPIQLIPWLRANGYPFEDIRKDTILKVIGENKDQDGDLDDPQWGGTFSEVTSECFEVMKLRQNSARLSVKKYDKLKASQVRGRFRNGFQFAGAARTNRAAGRGINPQNLTRTPKNLEPDAKHWEAQGYPGDYLLNMITEAIRQDDYSMVNLMVKEPMDALAGTVRSAIRAPEGYEFIAADLSSIETCVSAWLSGCDRLLSVIRAGQDPYKDFATILYHVQYMEVTKNQRQMAKPAVLGACYRLGGGELKNGKRTGLWGYAESLGVNMTQADSVRSVKAYREAYPEIPKLWYALEEAVERCIRTGRATQPVIMIGSRKFVVPVVIEMMKPYLTIRLPIGDRRRMYYYKPRIVNVTRVGKNGESYTKKTFTYMGKEQGSNVWKRLESHGGKIMENIVQALARDVLMQGYLRASKMGFKIVMHVHDELVALIKKGDNYFTIDRLIECMIKDIPGADGLPLRADGQAFAFYRK
jgi:DNA polymerase